MSLRSMKIAPRAFLGFAVIAMLVVVLGVFASNRMAQNPPGLGGNGR